MKSKSVGKRRRKKSRPTVSEREVMSTPPESSSTEAFTPVSLPEPSRSAEWALVHVSGQHILLIGCDDTALPVRLSSAGKQATCFEVDESLESGGSYDTVLVTVAPGRVPALDQTISVAARHLQPGGVLAMTVPFGLGGEHDENALSYLSKPYQALAGAFDINQIEPLGEFLGFVAQKRPRPRPRGKLSLPLQYVETLEMAFLAREQALRVARSGFEPSEAGLSGESAAPFAEELKFARAEIEELRRLNRRLEEDLAKSFAAQTPPQRDIDQEVRHARLEAEAQAQQQAAQAALAAANEKSAALQRVLEERQGELERAWSMAREEATRVEKSTRDREKQLQKTRIKLERELGGLRARYEDLRSRFAELKSHFSSNEQARIDAVQRLTEAHRQLAEAEHRLAELEHRACEAEQRLIDAGHRLLETSGSTSYQLGSALVSAGTSFRGLISLPRRLLDVGRSLRVKRGQEPGLPALEHQTSGALGLPGPTPAVPVEVEDATVVSLTSAEWSGTLKSLRVATIADDFTFASYQPECNLFQLTPAAWREELEQFRPELLFIESAWRGKDELWGNRVSRLSEEVRGIVAWCKERNVPTVFWNKEDPIHYSTFLNTARLFDHVFTTDFDCIHLYKAALGHDRVYLLPFAAQPATNNPIEIYERKDAFCFAGAYYVRYPERARDLEDFVAKLPRLRPLEIFDRNYGKDDPNYAFPERYRPFIVGNLPFAEIDRAYKGYQYAINLNSIKQSQTMFARRVYELLASNTLTISNYSRGVRLLFGDLVIATDSGGEALRRLEAVDSHPGRFRKIRLAALRKVMSQHTYEDRLAYIVSKVRGQKQPSTLPSIVVVGHVQDEAEASAILANFRRQSYEAKRLVLIAPRNIARRLTVSESQVSVMTESEARGTRLAELGRSTDWSAGFVPADYYGPNYLTDFALATRYAEAPIIGKRAHHAVSADSTTALIEDGAQYRLTTEIPARTAAERLGHAGGISVYAWAAALPAGTRTANQALALDEFNYCRDAGPSPDRCVLTQVDDLVDVDTGIDLADLQQRAEGIVAHSTGDDATPVITGRELGRMLTPPSPETCVSLSDDGDALRIDSEVGEAKLEYWYATTRSFAPQELGAEAGQLRLHLECSPGLNVQFVCVFLDEKKKRIGHAVRQANRNETIDLTEGTVQVRLGLRIFGPGTATVKCLALGHRRLEPAELLTRGRFLLVTNQYPSTEELYRNAFVHRRVVAYRKAGTIVDVFRMRPGQSLSYHEFENVDCITGSSEALHHLLDANDYQGVLVHCLDESMWAVLKDHIARLCTYVWVHGAEIQPIHRREFNFLTPQRREAAQRDSDRRQAFWRDILNPMPANLTLIFVSRYLAEEVMEDLGFRLPDEQYRIIHNPIDTELFQYRPKPAGQRYKVLSIRPYASHNYANDLAVKTILELAEQPWFRRMEFRLIGDGPLFEETVAPLRALPNVILERRFLPQYEIAALHREYGIWLSPTRSDTQGVSRDEAMSSGLVPVTNAVTAVPEFVDESCGILAPAEDFKELARGIESLLEDPDRFLEMSRAAAERVRRQSHFSHVVLAELSAFGA